MLIFWFLYEYHNCQPVPNSEWVVISPLHPNNMEYMYPFLIIPGKKFCYTDQLIIFAVSNRKSTSVVYFPCINDTTEVRGDDSTAQRYQG